MMQGYEAETSLGFFQQAATAAVVSLASLFPGGVIPSGTAMVVVQCEGAAIRYRDDGTAPTATVGMPLAVGQVLNYTGRNLNQLQFIAQTGTATIDVIAYKQGG